MHMADVLAAAATWTARLMRDSSPPDATFGEALERLPGIRTDQELDVIAALGAEFAVARQDVHGETSTRHAERLHQRGDAPAEQRRRRFARLRQAQRRRTVFVRDAGEFEFQPVQACCAFSSAPSSCSVRCN